jgi:hypothetical protein
VRPLISHARDISGLHLPWWIMSLCARVAGWPNKANEGKCCNCNQVKLGAFVGRISERPRVAKSINLMSYMPGRQRTRFAVWMLAPTRADIGAHGFETRPYKRSSRSWALSH